MEKTNFPLPPDGSSWKIIEGKEGKVSYLHIASSEQPIKIEVKKSLTKFDKVIAKLFRDPWKSIETVRGTVYIKTSILKEKNITRENLSSILNKNTWVSSTARKKQEQLEQTKPPLGERTEQCRQLWEEKSKAGEFKDLAYINYETPKGTKATVTSSGNVYVHLHELGKGVAKTAIAAHDVLNEENVAILTSLITSPAKRKTAEKEEKIFTLFKGSEHVVQLKNVSWIQNGEKTEQKMVMELCNGGELKSWMSNKDKKLTFPQKLKVAQDVILGVDEFHKKNHIHSDLKPDNLFVKIDPTQPKQISVKIGDLGSAYNLLEIGSDHRIEKKGREGTPKYMAPRHLEQLLKTRVEELTVPMEIMPRTADEKLADEKFELGLVLFQLFYPNEFNKLPWFNELNKFGQELKELEELRADYDEGVSNEYLKEWDNKKAAILDGIEAMNKSVDEFVKKEMDRVDDHDPIVLREAILKMLSCPTEQKNAATEKKTASEITSTEKKTASEITSLEEEKKVFDGLVYLYPIS